VLGGVIGGNLPRWLAGSADPSPVYFGYALWVAAAGFLPGVAALLAMRGTSSPAVAELPAAARPNHDPAPIVLIAMMMIIMIFDVSGEGIGRVFTNKLMEDVLKLPPPVIGSLFSGANLIAGIAVLCTPLLVARLRLSMAFIVTTLGMSLSVFLLGAVPHWIAAGIGYAGLLGMSQMARAVKTQYAMEVVTVGWRGHMAGWMQFFETLTVWQLSVIGGGVIAQRGYAPVFLTVAVSTAIAAVIFYFFFHRVPRGEYARAAAAAQNALPPLA
jgi:hypothetical protein